MAYQKLSPVTLIAAVQDKVETLTGLRCYDHVPLNEESPLSSLQTVKRCTGMCTR